MKRLTSLLLALGLVLVIDYGQALAAAGTSGVTVSPAIDQINLSQNQTTASFSVRLNNHAASSVVVLIGAQDFTAQASSGALQFLGQSAAANNSHGLATALQFGLTQIALAPGQTQNLPVTITGTDKLAPGGHYGAITYKLVNEAKASGNNVTLDETLTTLIFLTTYGGGTQTSTLTTPVIGSITASWPQNLNLVFANNGTTQTTPRGLAQIIGSHNKLIAQGVINVNSGLVLPDSKRLFNTGLLKQRSPSLWPATYYLRITYGHDGQTNPQVYQVSFLYINPLPMIIAIVVLAFVAVLARHLWRRKARRGFTRTHRNKN